MTTSRVVVYVRQGCHLCDDAVSVVRRVCGSDFEAVDIDAAGPHRSELLAKYSTKVPATLVDGREVGVWWLKETDLRAALG